MKLKVDTISKSLLAMMAVVALLFAGSLLAASISVAGFMVYSVVGYGMVVALIWIVLDVLEHSGGEWFKKYEPWIIMGAFLVFYLAFMEIVPEFGQKKMPYDSLRAQKSLEAGHIAFFRPTRLYYWVNYDLLLSSLGIVFSPRLIVGQIVNAVCRAATLYPVFKLSERVSGHGTARLVTIITALSPALTLYSSTLVGDYISAMFYLYAVYFFITKSDWKRFSVDNAVLWIAVGLLAGLGYVFKTISFLYFASLMVWMILKVFERRDIRVILLACVSIVTVGLSHNVVKSIREKVLGAAYEVAKVRNEPASFTGGVLYELWMGLCIQTGGGYSPSRDKAFRAASKEKQIGMIKAMLINDRTKYPQFFVNKFRSVWGSNDSPGSMLDWFRMSCQEDCYNRNDKNYCVSWLKPLLRAEHLFLAMIFLAGVCGFVLSMRKTMEFLGVGVISLVMILSFAAMSMLIESHGRYRAAIYPFFFLVLPYACVWLKKDNPVYVCVCGFSRKLIAKIRAREKR